MLVILALVLLLVPPLALLESRLAPQRAAVLAMRAQGQSASTIFGDQQPWPSRNLHYRSLHAPGYGGDIRLLLAIDTQGCLRGVAALAHHESPGYGAPLLTRQALADRAGWLRGLLDRCHGAQGGTEVLARVDRAGTALAGTALAGTALAGVDATTGATITANAVHRALRAALAAAHATAPASGLQTAQPAAAAGRQAAAERSL